MEREQQREKKKNLRSARKGKKNRSLPEAFAAMDISLETCPLCHRGQDESEEGSRWICCDQCERWFHFDCLNIIADDVPDVFVCSECVEC